MSPSKRTAPSPAALEIIAADLRRMHEGGAWHGPSVREALEGVSVEMAVARPIPGGHTIYELTHHVAAWIGEVTRRLAGGMPRSPADGDFPAHSEIPDAAAWAALRRRLSDRHVELERAILAFDPVRLDEFVGEPRDASLGKGMSYRATLYGVIEHDAYHAGQIVLLRKALGR